MTKEEFCALPPNVALGLLWDTASGAILALLAEMPAPQLARAPKYDQKIRRKGGYQWASETDANGLQYWQKALSERNEGEYAEKNQKDARGLGYWLAWRLENPSAAWTGERNKQVVTAAPPSAKPTIHEWEQKREEQQVAAPAVSFDEAGDDQLPF